MVEGSAIHEKRLRPLQKGFARITFGTLDRFPDIDVKIVPIGVNYTYADQFRSEVMIDVGEPISSKQYQLQSGGNLNKAINLLKQEVEVKLKGSIVHINKEEDELLVDVLHVINRTNKNRPFASWNISRDPEPLEEEKAIANFVNDLPEDQKATMKDIANIYRKDLEGAGLADYLLGKESLQNSTSDLIFLIVGFIPYMIGYLVSAIPFQSGKYITEKFIFFTEFYSPVRIAATLGVNLIFNIIVILGILISGEYWLFILVAVAPFFSYFSLKYSERYERWQMINKYHQTEPEVIEQLKRDRNILEQEASPVLFAQEASVSPFSGS